MKHPSILKTVLAQAKRAVFIYSLPSCTGLSASADNVETLGGFAYGDATAPEGNEWNNPEALALNKEQPTATFYPFLDTESARKVLPENSKYWICLNDSSVIEGIAFAVFHRKPQMLQCYNVTMLHFPTKKRFGRADDRTGKKVS